MSPSRVRLLSLLAAGQRGRRGRLSRSGAGAAALLARTGPVRPATSAAATDTVAASWATAAASRALREARSRARRAAPRTSASRTTAPTASAATPPAAMPAAPATFPRTSAAASRSPADSPPVHGGCATQPATSCGTTGLCDGAGQCQLYDDTTVCGDAACEKGSNTFFPEARCDGRGSCAAAARRPVVRAVHVQAGRQGLRRPLRRPDRVRVAQPVQQRIVRHDRQRPALPQRRPVPVRLLCRRRLLQRTLHGTVHGLRI